MPFRNKFYFNQWVAPKHPPTGSRKTHTIGKPPEGHAKQAEVTKGDAKQAEVTKEADKSDNAKQVEVTNNVQNGSANSVDFKKEPKKTKKHKGSKRKKTVAKKQQRLLQLATDTEGQTTVRDFFFTETETGECEIVRHFLFSSAQNDDETVREPSVIVIDSSASSDCIEIEVTQTGGFDDFGPVNVSSPMSDTQIFDDHPSQSPIY